MANLLIRNRSQVVKRRWCRRRIPAFEPLEPRQLLAISAALSLGRPTVIGGTAEFDVTLDYAADNGELLAFFSLDVEPSSTNLIGPGPNFSAFSFEKASPLLDEWTQIGFFNDPGFESSVEFDDSLIAPLASGVYRLGTLRVDFAGVSLGDTITVSLEGNGTAIGVDDANGFHFEPVTFAPGSRTLLPGIASGPENVSEGSEYFLSVDTALANADRVIIDWGDGQQSTIPIEDLPENGEVTHVFPDGPLTPTIDVTIIDANGGTLASGELSVSIDDVAPTVVLSGPATIDEDAQYTLTIGPVVDPGQDTVTQYIIDWGDGQRETINAPDLPANRQVNHQFTEGGQNRTIQVDVVNEDGTHPAAGSIRISINETDAPSVEIIAESTAVVGVPFDLQLGEITGPGSENVTSISIDWGDGQAEVFDLADLPDDRTLIHTFQSPGAIVIAVELLDDAGQPLARITRSITVFGSTAVTLVSFNNSASVPGETQIGEAVLVSGTLLSQDFDNLQVLIDLGDGAAPVEAVITPNNGTATISARHSYTVGGIYTITGIILENGTPVLTAETTAYITGTRIHENRIQMVGSDENDIITVTPSGSYRLFVDMTLPGSGNFREYYNLADVTGIDVYVGAGNDRVMVSPRLSIETWINGGPHNDSLQGGNGPNIIFGESGNDTLLGGQSRDVLIGGEGVDRIVGYNDDDVLAGDRWPELEMARDEVFDTWNSDESFEERRATLLELLTLVADQQADSLIGGSGNNLFLLSAGDVFSDADPNIERSLNEALELGWVLENHVGADVRAVIVGGDDEALDESLETTAFEAESTITIQTVFDRRDVNRDGVVTSRDIGLVVNALFRHGIVPLPDDLAHLDATGDGRLSPQDALAIIGYLRLVAAAAQQQDQVKELTEEESPSVEAAVVDDSATKAADESLSPSILQFLASAESAVEFE